MIEGGGGGDAGGGGWRTRVGGQASKQAVAAGDPRGDRACTEGDGAPITPTGALRQLVAAVMEDDDNMYLSRTFDVVLSIIVLGLGFGLGFYMLASVDVRHSAYLQFHLR